MSVWNIERAGDRVKLTYVRDPLAPHPVAEDCGSADAVLEVDLEAWVFEQAAPWDLIRTARGTFARLLTVAPERSVSTDPPSEAIGQPAPSV
jgi:hypothetical protein